MSPPIPYNIAMLKLAYPKLLFFVLLRKIIQHANVNTTWVWGTVMNKTVIAGELFCAINKSECSPNLLQFIKSAFWMSVGQEASLFIVKALL